MSFSQEVKEELSRHIPGARHCQLAELAALVSFLCKLTTKGKETALILETESLPIARKYFTLLNKKFRRPARVNARMDRTGY